MSDSKALTQAPPSDGSLKSLLQNPFYEKRFKELLGARSAQFVSSVLSVGNSLGADCEPTSIITSAMTAATLDLPVDKNLGFAWIVPYRSGNKKQAQFQMGYKGYIQLGLRTGQYERMNARVINAEAFVGWDEVGEPIIDWSKIDETQPSIGYVFAFKLVNGFTKIAYWSKERVQAHAKRYSKSYGGNYSSPWTTDFDPMALKTVIKNELAKWGILSIEMISAIKHDQATKSSLDDDPQYPDGLEHSTNGQAGIEGIKERLAIGTQEPTPSNDQVIDVVANEVVETDEASAVDEPETKVKNAPTPAESRRLDQIAAIEEIEKEDPERVALILEDRKLSKLSASKVEDIYNALTAS